MIETREGWADQSDDVGGKGGLDGIPSGVHTEFFEVYADWPWTRLRAMTSVRGCDSPTRSTSC